MRKDTKVILRDAAETDYTYIFKEVWEGPQAPAAEKALIQLSEEIDEGKIKPELPLNRLAIVYSPQGTALVTIELKDEYG